MICAIDKHGFGSRMRREVASRRLLASCFLIQLHRYGHSGHAGFSFNCFCLLFFCFLAPRLQRRPRYNASWLCVSPAAAPPHPPSVYIFKTPNGVRVPAAHFYADIRCGNPRQEPSSKSRHCSCSPFLGGHPLQESRAGRTSQQTPPLFQPPVFFCGHPWQPGA